MDVWGLKLFENIYRDSLGSKLLWSLTNKDTYGIRIWPLWHILFMFIYLYIYICSSEFQLLQIYLELPIFSQ